MRARLALADHIRLNRPLPWDVYNDAGVLLLSKGSIPLDERQMRALVERGAYVDQREYEEYRRSNAREDPAGLNPFDYWEDAHLRLGNLLKRSQSELRFVEKLGKLSSDIQSLVDRDIDLAIYHITRLDKSHYPVAHAMQVAVCCDIYGRFLNWPQPDRRTIIHAGLTMNISMLELQQLLATQLEPPTPEQRAQIQRHSTEAQEWLRSIGVNDEAWLRAVEEHHETGDGRGYPRGLLEVSPIAEVLQIADRYCALMSPRSTRPAIPANLAARRLYLSTSGSVQIVSSRMIKVFGLFPPGNFVRLANGEIAIVVRRGLQANQPQVATVMTGKGIKLIDPIRRDTALPEYAVDGFVSEENVVLQIDTPRLFGFKAP